MEWLKKNKISPLIIFLFLITISCYSQKKDANILLIIDNEIVTNQISFSFVADSSTYEFSYSMGEKLRLPNELLQSEEISLKFKYWGMNNDYPKRYNYDFEFKKGWLNNTFFLIIRIYNLDKKKFKKAFCKKTEEYVIEVENSVYTQSHVMCRKLKNKF